MSTANNLWPRRMNHTDALFWYMDKIPDLRSTIGSLLILQRAPTRAAMHAEIDRMGHLLPRMRQRVVEVPFGLAPPEWVEDPLFDLDYHLRFVAVPEPAGLEEVLDLMGPLYASPFDYERPLWETYVIEGMRDGRGAVFMKMHHCGTDGVGGARLSEQLMREIPAVGRVAERPRGPEPSITPAALLWRALGYNVEEALSTGADLLSAVGALLLSPAEMAGMVRRNMRALTGLGQQMAAPAVRSSPSGPRSLSRRLSTFEMSLRDIDAVREQWSATNNDVVLTIVAGAMHRWHTARGDDTRELRVLVPVNLRSGNDVQAGNRIAMVSITLPIGEPNPVRRLRVIQERTGRVKTDRRASLYPLLARAMLAMPRVLTERLSRQQMTMANFVCTNVPGSRQAAYMAGIPVEAIYPWGPLVGDHPVAIALYSYGERMYVGLDIDPLAMSDLPAFRDALREAYEEVLNVGRRAERQTRPRARRKRRARRAQARVSA
jgi:diacylglycerol O-acyltransferase